jgi:hypothetical protein
MTGEITTINTTMWRDKNNKRRQNNLPAAVYIEQDEMDLLKARPCHSVVKSGPCSYDTVNQAKNKMLY